MRKIKQGANRLNIGGFTLIESMVTLTIILTIANFSVPNVMAMMKKNTIRSIQEHLVQDLRLSRVTAKANSVTVTICPSINGQSCENTQHWHTGWISFADENSNKIVEASEKVISRFTPAQPLSINVSLHAAGRAKQVKINSSGLIRTSGHIRICNSSIEQDKIQTIKLNNRGRMNKELRKTSCV